MPVDLWEAFVLGRSRSASTTQALAESEPLVPAEEAAPTVAARPWVLLSAVPRLGDAFDLPLKDMSLELEAPPRVSVVTVSRRVLHRNVPVVLPVRPAAKYPYVSAVDESGGALLLCSNNPSDWNDGDPQHHHRRYYLYNPVARTARHLVDLVVHGHPGSIGLARRPGTRRSRGLLTAVVLTPRVGFDMADLFYRSPSRWFEDWASVSLECLRPDNQRPWGNNGAFALDGKLWWVDLACGLLTCDPFARHKALRFIGLPPGCAVDTTERNVLRDLDKTRCVKISGGKVRYVHIHRPDGVATVTMWSLGGADGDHRWECDFSVPFGDIWADASYAAATEPPLVKEVPVLALVHPYDPAVVYFWEPLGGARLFSVNVPAKKVIECGEQFSVPDYGIPEAEFPSSRTIHAWHLPPPLHYRLHGSAVLRALLCLCGPDDLPDEEQSSAVGFTLHM